MTADRFFDAAQRLRSSLDRGDVAETVQVAASDLAAVLDAVYWAAPAWDDPATVVLGYVHHAVGRLTDGERRRVAAWMWDEFGTAASTEDPRP